MENEKLEVGDKYLSIRILGKIDLVAFQVKDKKSENYPDFKGDGIAIWVKKKLPEKPKEELI